MILDVGCGNQPQGHVNVELNIQQDNRLAPDNHPLDPRKIHNLIRASGCCLPFRDSVFTHVFSRNTIEHIGFASESYVETPFRFLKELVRVCKGKVEIYCPHRADPSLWPENNPRHKAVFNKKWFQTACAKLGVYHSATISGYRGIPHNLIPVFRLPNELHVYIFVAKKT